MIGKDDYFSILCFDRLITRQSDLSLRSDRIDQTFKLWTNFRVFKSPLHLHEELPFWLQLQWWHLWSSPVRISSNQVLTSTSKIETLSPVNNSVNPIKVFFLILIFIYIITGKHIFYYKPTLTITRTEVSYGQENQMNRSKNTDYWRFINHFSLIFQYLIKKIYSD